MTRRPSPGRPPTIHARRVTVSLDDETLDRLREIGDGNVSGAIRWLVGNFIVGKKVKKEK